MLTDPSEYDGFPSMARLTSLRTGADLFAMIVRTLAIFGYVKGYFIGAPPLRSASQTVLIGGLAAAVAFMIARLIS